MQNELPDQQARNLALDPTQSFIVQAPAGSGKTTLLTNRFLTLLSLVKNPEEILAITFTRKAASEMRNRIIEAIETCSQHEDPQIETNDLARKVLEQDKKHNWNLLENPNRLRIQTIDAFCTALTKQTPILSGFGVSPKITENPDTLYEQATSNLLQHLHDSNKIAADIEVLLLHLDNRLDQVKNLLVNMLKKRDQWLEDIVQLMSTVSDTEVSDTIRLHLEQNLLKITQDALKDLYDTLPHKRSQTQGCLTPSLLDELLSLAEFALNITGHTASGRQVSDTTVSDTLGYSFPDTVWKTIADWLFTNQNTLRKTVDKRQGFPSPASAKNKEEKAFLKEQKMRMENLLEALHHESNFLSALINLRNVPPVQYTEPQWQVLKALMHLLPIAVAELKLVFQAHSEVDFIEVSEAALKALGSIEAPTDLALMLDYKIQHLLVDEFQDTSIAQFNLLKKLTLGWENVDGRTLFLVGDPMQSIYRFRNAEVGLFLRAQHEGINTIQLIPIKLSTNFRATASLIHWINEVFPTIFPKKEDVANGAVTYHSMQIPLPDKHESSSLTNEKPETLQFQDRESEAEYISDLVTTLQQKFPNDTIAILVKARDHAKHIFENFRIKNIPYQAIEMDKLYFRPVIQDLLALTKALLHPADRIAWLAILRAPWCGLTLKDLHLIAQIDLKNTILANIQQPELYEKLSEDSQNRLLKFYTIIQKAIDERRSKNLRILIEDTWVALNGPTCVHHLTDLDDAKAYFDLLDQYDRQRDAADLAALEKKLKTLFASSDRTFPKNKLEMMTIHKSKGLEFDTVIVPGFNRATKPKEPQLLLWKKEIESHQTERLILAPIKPAENESEAIYQYLAQKESEQSKLEEQRLFYVATTRAKKRLFLTEVPKSEDPDPTAIPQPNNIFLSRYPTPSEPPFQMERSLLGPSKDRSQPVLTKNIQIIHSPYSKIVGTFIHQILEQISKDGIENWDDRKISNCTNNWENILKQKGILPTQIEPAILSIQKALQNTLKDPRGRWILQNHQNAQSELAISTSENNEIQHVIIDRTFIDEDGERWIIDYKTTHYQGNDLDQFLDQEKQKHQQQLHIYAKALKKIFSENMHFGLYFPLIPAWIEW